MNRLTSYLLLMGLSFNVVASEDDQKEVEYLFSLNIDELAERNIISASNFNEKLSDAPATVIVVSNKEITERGYSDVSEIFDDLPGMEVIRTWGDTYFVNYMRGYRYTIGSPYLVMIDGVIQNTLYFGITTPLATIPLSYIDRVEVVYGPASTVYGANAFMGVINVITRQDPTTDGPHTNAHFSVGSDGFKIADVHLSYKNNDWRVNFASRIEHGDLNDRLDSDDIYWLNDEHYDNTRLWGALAQQANGFTSYVLNKAFDLRIAHDKTELALTYQLLDSGYGTVYPADRIPSDGVWPRLQYGGYIKHQWPLSKTVDSRTLLRYRHDGVPNNTFDIEAWNITNSLDQPQTIGDIELEPGESARMLHLTYWQSLNNSWSFYQDFEIDLAENWLLTTGLKYEYKDLQKAYNLSTRTIAPEAVNLDDPTLYPSKPGKQQPEDNTAIWEDVGWYVQSRYQLNSFNIFNLGFRLDHNSQYGSDITYRGGYVHHWDSWTAKLLYGQAFQEPVPRNLYGAWTGSGSAPDLTPEQSETFEASINYRSLYMDSLISLYRINNTETIINFTGGAKNLGSRNVSGLDFHLRWHAGAGHTKLRAWLYFSWLLEQKEQVFDFNNAASLGHQDIGDLADKKLQFGLTADFNEKLTLTLRGRYIGSRDTVTTNPIDKMDSFATFDANLIYRAFLHPSMDLSFKITNLLDKRYFHPGIRDADGVDPNLTPGALESIGWSGANEREWTGSTGWYNARLPQPGRQFYLQLKLSF